MATIYHNPRCSKSRETLDLLRRNGVEPTIVEYLREPLSREELGALFASAGLTPRDMLREKQKEAKVLGLTKESSDADILDAMVSTPILIERPIVRTGKGTRLCRPPERVLEIL